MTSAALHHKCKYAGQPHAAAAAEQNPSEVTTAGAFNPFSAMGNFGHHVIVHFTSFGVRVNLSIDIRGGMRLGEYKDGWMLYIWAACPSKPKCPTSDHH